MNQWQRCIAQSAVGEDVENHAGMVFYGNMVEYDSLCRHGIPLWKWYAMTPNTLLLLTLHRWQQVRCS